MTGLAAELICLLSRKKPHISIGIMIILRIKKYQQVMAYLGIVVYQFACITES